MEESYDDVPKYKFLTENAGNGVTRHCPSFEDFEARVTNHQFDQIRQSKGDRKIYTTLKISGTDRTDMQTSWVDYPEWLEYKVGNKAGKMTVTGDIVTRVYENKLPDKRLSRMSSKVDIGPNRWGPNGTQRPLLEKLKAAQAYEREHAKRKAEKAAARKAAAKSGKVIPKKTKRERKKPKKHKVAPTPPGPNE